MKITSMYFSDDMVLWCVLVLQWLYCTFFVPNPQPQLLTFSA